MTVETHCELTKRLLSLYESEWRSRVAAAEANRGDRKSLYSALETIAARHRPLRAALYAHYETSERADGRFANEHQQEIRGYLDAHRDDETEIASARKRLDALIQRFESLMQEERRRK